MLKKWWVWVLIFMAVFAIIGSTTGAFEEGDQAEEPEETPEEEVDQEPEEEVEEPQEEESDGGEVEETQAEAEEGEDTESSSEDVTWDDMKETENIVGKSDKDFSELSSNGPRDVRNDNTGNWKLTTITDNEDFMDYALSYWELHMEEEEVHHVINFTLNTTTWLNELGGLLYVDVKERVDGEEHDASTLGSGMLLKSYIVYPDGDIEELEI